MSAQPIIVTVTYQKDPSGKPVVKVDPNLVQVAPGQAIRFKPVLNGVVGTMRITFTEPQFFETGTFRDGDRDVRVKTLTRRTTYVCELLDAGGKQIARSEENAGGAAEPVDK